MYKPKYTLYLFVKYLSVHFEYGAIFKRFQYLLAQKHKFFTYVRKIRRAFIKRHKYI